MRLANELYDSYSWYMTVDAASLTVAQARAGFADVLNRVTYAHDRITLTRRGRVVGALISGEDLALLEQLEDARDADELRQAIAADDGRRVNSAELLAELDGELPDL